MATGLIVLAAIAFGQLQGSSPAPQNNWYNVQRTEGARMELGWLDAANQFHPATEQRPAPPDPPATLNGAMGSDGAKNFGVDQQELRADGVGTVYTSDPATESKARGIVAGDTAADAGDSESCKPQMPDIFGVKAEIHEIAVYALCGVLFFLSLFFLGVWGLIKWLR